MDKNRNYVSQGVFENTLVLRIPLTNLLSFNTGVEFYIGNLFGYELEEARLDRYYMQEFGISIPVLLQFIPSGKHKNYFYLTVGAQLGFPLETTLMDRNSAIDSDFYEPIESIFEHRVPNIGLVLGFGYMMSNIGFDFKYVRSTGLIEDFENSYIKYKDKSSLSRYSFGITYLL